MLKFKSRKGFVPALLTLGLVLIGSFVAIGVSFLTNNNKIALSSRASGGTESQQDADCRVANTVNTSQCGGTVDGVPFSQCGCCFCKYGNKQVLASAQARVANQMGTDCTKNDTVNSYAPASSAFYCDPTGGGGSGNPPPVPSCNGSGGGCSFNCEAIGEECTCGEPGNFQKGTCTTKGKAGTCSYCGGGGSGGGSCLNSTTVPKADPDNCTDFNSGTTIYPSHELSTKGNLIFDGKICSGEGKSINEAEDSFCAALNSGNCKPWDCHKVKSEWESQDLWKNYLNGTTYYYSSDVNCNTSGYKADSVELKNYCAPEAAPTCEETTCGDVVSNVDPSIADKKIYYQSDKPSEYFKTKSGGKCTNIIDINNECPNTSPTVPYYTLHNISYMDCDTSEGHSVLDEKQPQQRQNFIRSCISWHPNLNQSCLEIVSSDIGFWTGRNYLYCCNNKSSSNCGSL